MINMLKYIVKKVDSIHEKMGLSSDIQNYFNRQIKMLEIKKNELSEIRISFNGRTSRLDAAKKRMSKCGGRSI